MDRVFRKVSDGTKVDLLEHSKMMMEENPDCTIFVGCDSQNVGSQTIYVTTVVFRFENNGAHAIYRREKIDKIKDIWTKLWGELQRSIDIAGYLTFEGGIKVHQIDLDYNKDPKYKSNKVLKAAVGYVESLGYKYASKPEMLISIHMANDLCR